MQVVVTIIGVVMIIALENTICALIPPHCWLLCLRMEMEQKNQVASLVTLNSES